MPITATLISVGASIPATIGQLTDMKKRREFEQALSLLTFDQRAQLERELQRTTSVDKRLEILANSLAQVRSAQAATAIKARQEAQLKREITTAIIVVGSAAIILIAVVLLKRK